LAVAHFHRDILAQAHTALTDAHALSFAGRALGQEEIGAAVGGVAELLGAFVIVVAVLGRAWYAGAGSARVTCGARVVVVTLGLIGGEDTTAV